jgi:hypothetical protein
MGTTSSNIENALSELSKGIGNRTSRTPTFMASVLSVSDDKSRLRVRLCTGRVIEVPVSILKNISALGTVSTDDESFGLTSGEIDVSTEPGELIQQLAEEISRLSRLLDIAHQRLRPSTSSPTGSSAAAADQVQTPATIKSSDIVQPATIVKIPFSGVAGFPKPVDYGKPTFQYIQDWSIFQLLHCSLTQPPRVVATGHDGNRPDRVAQIEFVLDAAPGTPLGTAYNAQLQLNVVLVQETT